MFRLKKTIFIAFLVTFPCYVVSEDFVWDGSQGTVTWADAANWTNGSGYPDANDDTATFNGTGSQSATTPGALSQ